MSGPKAAMKTRPGNPPNGHASGAVGDSVQAVRRSVRLLQVLADQPDDLSLQEVSRLAELAPSTAHRLLQTLAQDGLVTLLPRGSFRLGPETARLGGAAMGRLRISHVLHELMEQACRTTEETIGLVQAIDGAATVVDKVESPHPLRYELG